MKKLFGGINLTWKKLIIFAIITSIYTAIMALIPITKNTSFRDIAIEFEWWIFFGIIIISNSKSPLDSALKCFVFFLISQPLVYLIQVPFSSMGWELFSYYKYWFYWTMACLPMGYIGYYIKKKNWLSVIILSSMLVFLAYLGLGYINNAVQSFPHHLLSGIFCFLIIIVVILGVFDKKKLRLVSFGIALITTITLLIIKGDIGGTKYETYRNIDNLDITLVGKIRILSFTAKYKDGDVSVVNTDPDIHTLLISGWDSGEYLFTIEDEEENEYDFEYYIDKEQKTIVLNLIK